MKRMNEEQINYLKMVLKNFKETLDEYCSVEKFIDWEQCKINSFIKINVDLVNDYLNENNLNSTEFGKEWKDFALDIKNYTKTGYINSKKQLEQFQGWYKLWFISFPIFGLFNFQSNCNL